MKLVYFNNLTSSYPEADILFIPCKMSVDEINTIIDIYSEKNEKPKIICMIGESNDLEHYKSNENLIIKLINNVYRVWLDVEHEYTTYDNGFISTYDILCREFGKQFIHLPYNYKCEYLKDKNKIFNISTF